MGRGRPLPPKPGIEPLPKPGMKPEPPLPNPGNGTIAFTGA